MTFYADMADLATELLTEYGQAVTIKRITGGSDDPVTGVAVAGTTASLSSVGVLRPYPDRLIDGTRITASDRELTLDASVEPLMTDKITVQGQDWNIAAIVGHSPAGTVLCYRVQVRR